MKLERTIIITREELIKLIEKKYKIKIGTNRLSSKGFKGTVTG